MSSNIMQLFSHQPPFQTPDLLAHSRIIDGWPTMRWSFNISIFFYFLFVVHVSILKLRGVIHYRVLGHIRNCVYKIFGNASFTHIYVF